MFVGAKKQIQLLLRRFRRLTNQQPTVIGGIKQHHTCRLGYHRVNHPPHENFFLQKDTSEDFLDTPGPKIPYLGHFLGLSGVSGNTLQLPGVSRCIQVYPKKNFSAEGQKIFFSDGVN